MTFVFTSWYFVIIALIAGIVACAVFFFKMNKQDGVMIDRFIKENQPSEQTVEEKQTEVVAEEKKAE